MSTWAVPRRYSPLTMHQRRRLLAVVACYQAARATIPLAVLVAHRWAVLYACMKCVAQGVTRRRICTNECLGGAQEVPLAAHASTEALADGGGVLSSRTCNHDGVGGSSMGGFACMHEVRCSGRHPQTDLHQ